MGGESYTDKNAVLEEIVNQHGYAGPLMQGSLYRDMNTIHARNSILCDIIDCRDDPCPVICPGVSMHVRCSAIFGHREPSWLSIGGRC